MEEKKEKNLVRLNVQHQSLTIQAIILRIKKFEIKMASVQLRKMTSNFFRSGLSLEVGDVSPLGTAHRDN